jgi:hypothetical protein
MRYEEEGGQKSRKIAYVFCARSLIILQYNEYVTASYNNWLNLIQFQNGSLTFKEGLDTVYNDNCLANSFDENGTFLETMAFACVIKETEMKKIGDYNNRNQFFWD